MITINQTANLINVAVLGEFTLADYKEFEQQVVYQLRSGETVDLIVDLRDMASYTLDVAWEELKFAREHAHDFGKVAVITDNQWIAWSAWLSNMLTDAEVGVFAEEAEAAAWIAAQ